MGIVRKAARAVYRFLGRWLHSHPARPSDGKADFLGLVFRGPKYGKRADKTAREQTARQNREMLRLSLPKLVPNLAPKPKAVQRRDTLQRRVFVRGKFVRK